MPVVVERLEIVPYALRFEKPYATARGRIDRRELVLVRLFAEGLVGIGEAAALTLRGGEDAARVAAELEDCRPLVEHAGIDPARWAGGWAGAADRLRLRLSRPALAALEIALLDLAGKAVGSPAWQLLGGVTARPLECNATLTTGPPAEVARQAVDWAERGFRTFKLKAGTAGDVEQVAAARAALDPEARLRVDANGVWGLDQAVGKLALMEPLELAEQPVASLEEMAELRTRTAVPLCADESVETPEQARRAARSCDCVTIKLSKVGGPRAALRIAKALPAYLSSALDGPVGIAAAAHVAQALPDAGYAHGLATALLFSETVGRGAELDGPLLRVADGPGLGVELDEAALAAHRL